MSSIVKIDRPPAWLPSKNHSYCGTVILLRGDDDVPGQQVDVPADLLLAVSPLLRSILSAGHLPPAYHRPAITLSSATFQILQIVKELFVSGVASIDERTKVKEIQSVFKMLGIGVGLICDQTEEDDNVSAPAVNDPSRRPSIASPQPCSGLIPNQASNSLSDPLAKFSCYICDEKFNRAKELRKHGSEQHKVKKLFSCFSCRWPCGISNFRDYAHYERHLKTYRHGANMLVIDSIHSEADLTGMLKKKNKKKKKSKKEKKCPSEPRKKKVNISLTQNESQDIESYLMSVKNSPQSPHNPAKNPVKGMLKKNWCIAQPGC